MFILFDKDFRQAMGLSVNAGLGALKLTDGLDGNQWAEHEFGGAPLGDARLSKRLVSIAQAKGKSPGRAFSGAANGDWPATKAYYRMIDQPDGSAVSLPNIIEPHRRRTARRMMDQKTVFCLQDGRELNYTNLDQCTGLGGIKGQSDRCQNKRNEFTFYFYRHHKRLAIRHSKVTVYLLQNYYLFPQN